MLWDRKLSVPLFVNLICVKPLELFSCSLLSFVNGYVVIDQDKSGTSQPTVVTAISQTSAAYNHGPHATETNEMLDINGESSVGAASGKKCSVYEFKVMCRKRVGLNLICFVSVILQGGKNLDFF